MTYFARFSPVRASQDLREFLSQRRPYEFGFLLLAVVITAAVMAGFAHDSHAVRYRKPTIVYFQNWPADRSDAQIHAQQKIDLPQELARKAEIERLEAERRAWFKRVDDKLNSWGI